MNPEEKLKLIKKAVKKFEKVKKKFKGDSNLEITGYSSILIDIALKHRN